MSWLSQTPFKLKTFEANRTSEILESLPRRFWAHVSSKDNPADCASRGKPAANLLSFDLWWKGPKWLNDPLMYTTVFNPSNKFNLITDPEALVALKSNTNSMVIIVEDYNPIDNLLNRVSKLTKMRILAYMFKFVYAAKHPKTIKVSGLTFEN